MTLEVGPLANSSLVALDRRWRRTLVIATLFAVAALLATVAAGVPTVGACIALGLLLGAWNGHRVHASAGVVFAGGEVHKRALAASGMRRLGYVTFIVILLAVALRPYGWTVVIGLALFQFVLVANTAGLLLREVRRQ
jgi:hypothetical protein